MSDSFAPFRPVFRNPHFATVLTTFWPRQIDERRYPVQTRLFHTESDVQVLIHTQQPEKPRGEVVLVHGLEGSSHAPYMRSMAQTLLAGGFTVHRTNIRSCGGTEFLCSTLYHAGLTKDIFSILTDLDRQRRTPVYLVGFSLGGNQALKMAGELGSDAQRLLAGVVAISTPIDLAECCRMLALPSNRLYQWRFLSSMRKRLRLRRSAIAAKLPYDKLDGVRSVWEFDDLFTGPAFGFTGAEHYYSTQSAIRYLDQIRVPTLVIQAQDDPMIPFEVFSHPAFRNNANLTLAATRHGGHLGFLSTVQPRIWVDGAVRQWIAGTF
ncbi:MAG: alpha/beta fold hydrolase [Acidobacteriota bacterium]